MLLHRLLLLPAVVAASSVTVYVHSVPSSPSDSAAVIPSPIPLVQISYDADQTTGTVVSYTPPLGSYTSSHLLRVGLYDIGADAWKGVVTSAASFSEDLQKKFVVHVDEKGEPYHIGLGTSTKAAGAQEVEVEVLRKSAGPKPQLNKPVVLNADGKLDTKEPEKTFLQKYWWMIGLFLVVQLVAGGKE